MNMQEIVLEAKEYCKKTTSYAYQIKFTAYQNDETTVSALTDFEQWNSKTYEFLSPITIMPGDMVICLVKPGHTDAILTIGKCVGNIPICAAQSRTHASSTGLILGKFDVSWFTKLMQKQSNLAQLKRDAIYARQAAREANAIALKAINAYTKAGGNFNDVARAQ